MAMRWQHMHNNELISIRNIVENPMSLFLPCRENRPGSSFHSGENIDIPNITWKTNICGATVVINSLMSSDAYMHQ